MIRIIILIPCFNEEKNINNVISNINKYKFMLNSENYELDYIIINDCSSDGTINLCIKNGYNYLNLSSNLGIGGCVQTGYIYALERGYDIAIQHDGDGQHDPLFFIDVIRPIETGHADIVVGSRFINSNGFKSTFLRRVGIRILSNLIYLCSGIKIYDVTSGYRAVNRKYIKQFANQYAQDYPEPESLLAAAINRAKILEIPVVMQERISGKSSINLIKSLYYMIKVSLALILYRVTISQNTKRKL